MRTNNIIAEKKNVWIIIQLAINLQLCYPQLADLS